MKQNTIKPLGENILIRPAKRETKTSAGIYLPESANQEHSQIGMVVAIGDSDKIKVKAGQKVVFRRYGGEEVKIDGEDYMISSYKDVLAVIE